MQLKCTSAPSQLDLQSDPPEECHEGIALGVVATLLEAWLVTLNLRRRREFHVFHVFLSSASSDTRLLQLSYSITL